MRKLISKSNNNASEPSPFENASFTDPQLPTESDASPQSSTSNPQIVPQLQPSTHQMVTRLPPNSAWNELTQMIYNFQCDYRLSKKATNELLKVMDAARRFPDERLNMDWRTVLRHKTKHELELLKRSVGSNYAAKGNFSEDIFVCSKCAVTAFTLMEIQAAPECSACQVSAVLCSFAFAKQCAFAPLVWGTGVLTASLSVAFVYFRQTLHTLPEVTCLTSRNRFNPYF